MKQKHIMITGCSSGIGREAAIHFAEKGYFVFATVPSFNDLLDEAIADNSNIFLVEMDFLKPETIEKGCQIILRHLKRNRVEFLDALVNNVGTVKTGPIQYMDPTDY